VLDHGLGPPPRPRGEVLAFLRRRPYDRDPYRWSNFDFTSATACCTTVDAPAITDNGVHLIGSKSHPGQIVGDWATGSGPCPRATRGLRQPPSPGQPQGQGAQRAAAVLEGLLA